MTEDLLGLAEEFKEHSLSLDLKFEALALVRLEKSLLKFFSKSNSLRELKIRLEPNGYYYYELTPKNALSLEEDMLVTSLLCAASHFILNIYSITALKSNSKVTYKATIHGR